MTIDSEEVDAAIIYSGKCVGHWDDNLSKGVKAGTVTRLLLDLPALKEALQKTIAQEANKARVDEIKRVARELAEPKDKETWKDWSWRALYYLENRLKALTADKEQA